MAKALMYELAPPVDAVDRVSSTGLVRFDGLDVSIGGRTTLSRCEQHPADANSDWRLVIGEVAAYGAAWKRGQTWETPPVSIPIGFVTRAVYLWRMGETYRRDTGTCPACWFSKTPLPQPEVLLVLDDDVPPSGGSSELVLRGRDGLSTRSRPAPQSRDPAPATRSIIRADPCSPYSPSCAILRARDLQSSSTCPGGFP